MKIINCIVLSCMLTQIQIHTMDRIDLENIENALQSAQQAGFNRGLQAASIILGERIQQVEAQGQALGNVVQSQKNMIITQKFKTQRLITADNYNRQVQRSIRKDLLNSLQIQRNMVSAQNKTINTLVQQNDATQCKMERMQNMQWGAAGTVAMIGLVDPMEKEYLQDTTNLSAEEIDETMIGERLFALSALALCHPVSAAIVGTSAAVIKIKQYLQQ